MGNNRILNYGLVAGFAGIIFFLVIYLVDATLMASMWLNLAGILIVIIAMVLALMSEKKEGKGFIHFKNALKTSFGVYAVTALLSTLFSLLLFNVIDPELKDIIKKAAIENAEEWMAKFNTPQEEVDKAMERIESQDLTSPGKTVLSFFYSCIFGFILALIISAIMKKKPPESLESGGPGNIS